MTSPTTDHRKEWQRRPWVQILALILGVGPVCISTIPNYLRSDQAIPTNGIFFYMAGLSSIMIAVMLLLLKYLCGERIRDLNLKPGTWRKDIMVGIGLTLLTLGTLFTLRGPMSDIFPSKPDSGLGGFFDALIRNPLLFGLVVGPGLLIGAGIFEELTRVFILTRLWNMSTSRIWIWFGIVLSAVFFGSLHIYQGTAGAILAGISGLIFAVYYYYFGRLIPMILSHYLHDAIQIGAIFILANLS